MKNNLSQRLPVDLSLLVSECTALSSGENYETAFNKDEIPDVLSLINTSEWLPVVFVKCHDKKAQLLGGVSCSTNGQFVRCECDGCMTRWERAAERLRKDHHPPLSKSRARKAEMWRRIFTLEGFYEHASGRNFVEGVTDEDNEDIVYSSMKVELPPAQQHDGESGKEAPHRTISLRKYAVSLLSRYDPKQLVGRKVQSFWHAEADPPDGRKWSECWNVDVYGDGRHVERRGVWFNAIIRNVDAARGELELFYETKREDQEEETQRAMLGICHLHFDPVFPTRAQQPLVLPPDSYLKPDAPSMEALGIAWPAKRPAAAQAEGSTPAKRQKLDGGGSAAARSGDAHGEKAKASTSGKGPKDVGSLPLKKRPKPQLGDEGGSSPSSSRPGGAAAAGAPASPAVVPQKSKAKEEDKASPSGAIGKKSPEQQPRQPPKTALPPRPKSVEGANVSRDRKKVKPSEVKAAHAAKKAAAAAPALNTAPQPGPRSDSGSGAAAAAAAPSPARSDTSMSDAADADRRSGGASASVSADDHPMAGDDGGSRATSAAAAPVAPVFVAAAGKPEVMPELHGGWNQLAAQLQGQEASPHAKAPDVKPKPELNKAWEELIDQVRPAISPGDKGTAEQKAQAAGAAAQDAAAEGRRSSLAEGGGSIQLHDGWNILTEQLGSKSKPATAEPAEVAPSEATKAAAGPSRTPEKPKASPGSRSAEAGAGPSSAAAGGAKLELHHGWDELKPKVGVPNSTSSKAGDADAVPAASPGEPSNHQKHHHNLRHEHERHPKQYATQQRQQPSPPSQKKQRQEHSHHERQQHQQKGQQQVQQQPASNGTPALQALLLQQLTSLLDKRQQSVPPLPPHLAVKPIPPMSGHMERDAEALADHMVAAMKDGLRRLRLQHS